MMPNNFIRKLRVHLSKSRGISLNAIKPRSIDRFLRTLPGDIHWRPDYLFEDTQSNKYMAFTIIYDAEYFPDTLCQKVRKAIQHWNLDFFFVLENQSLLDMFEQNCLENGFGLILHKHENLLLVRDAIKPIIPKKTSASYGGHYPLWVIKEITNIKMGNSIFRTILKDFARGYFGLKRKGQLDEQKEEALVKNTILALLRSDTRYTSGVESLEILSRFEVFFANIRDHYFHSFHIYLLGLLILDHYKEDFSLYYKTVFPKYPGFSIEFLWLLTAIFHDVGYPIAKFEDLKEDIFGTPITMLEKETASVWDNEIYKENLKQLISLFKFSLSDKKHKIDWYPEVFGSKDPHLERIFRKSFSDAHGVAGCFRFLVHIFYEAVQEEDQARKVFLVNHIYPAALSISLHDRIFRERLTEIGVTKIKLSRFPFAVLLGYLDSLQEDRRDRFLCVESPELLQGFEYNGKVVASINEGLAETYPRLGKLKAECRDFINFVECDGIKFQYPNVLSL